ncbi:LOW QUALITY PROTEIN: uncharacterized protein, partial [Erythrolamprus reginae]|uniref:LOW QUALITY PROTEIN: uncharacterized protein n=1 Tax=Erythrolamprus reginae TaxID=121349 RepID=UPI00396C5E6D
PQSKLWVGRPSFSLPGPAGVQGGGLFSFGRAPVGRLASVCSSICAKCGLGKPCGARPANKTPAVAASPVLVLVCIYLVTLSLSLLGSGSILVMAVLRRRCCCHQLRPLALLSLADFLGAAVLIPTMAIHLLPSQHFGAAHRFCPYGRMFGMMFFAISLLMVLVYACEVNRAVRGWRETQESGSCCPRLQLALPCALAWLLPCLVVLALMVLGGGATGSPEGPLQPLLQAGRASSSSGASNLSCSSCLVLDHLSHHTCDKEPRQPGPQHSGQESGLFFLAFVALVVSACVVLYCRVERWQCRDRRGLQSESLRHRSRLPRSFQLVLVVCWLPACLLVALSLTGLQLSSLFPLLVATALTAPLQGFLHSLVYGWLRGGFRQEVAGERLPLYCSPGLKASFDDSLATSG